MTDEAAPVRTTLLNPIPRPSFMIITLDGPAGSGKSTTARAVAERLGYLYLDTGAMYRAVALAFLQENADATAEAAERILPTVTVDVHHVSDGAMRVRLNGEDVSERIRTQVVGTMASRISALQAVRQKMVREQRRIGRERNETEGGVVLDGRDTGTVVFPSADLKIYMKADPRERARRRQAQYAEEGRHVPLNEVQKEIEERDEKDKNRDIAPLRKAEDAVELDTTERSIQDQVEFVVEHARAQQGQGT